MSSDPPSSSEPPTKKRKTAPIIPSSFTAEDSDVTMATVEQPEEEAKWAAGSEETGTLHDVQMTDAPEKQHFTSVLPALRTTHLPSSSSSTSSTPAPLQAVAVPSHTNANSADRMASPPPGVPVTPQIGDKVGQQELFDAKNNPHQRNKEKSVYTSLPELLKGKLPALDIRTKNTTQRKFGTYCAPGEVVDWDIVKDWKIAKPPTPDGQNYANFFRIPRSGGFPDERSIRSVFDKIMDDLVILHYDQSGSDANVRYMRERSLIHMKETPNSIPSQKYPDSMLAHCPENSSDRYCVMPFEGKYKYSMFKKISGKELYNATSSSKEPPEESIAQTRTRRAGSRPPAGHYFEGSPDEEEDVSVEFLPNGSFTYARDSIEQIYHYNFVTATTYGKELSHVLEDQSFEQRRGYEACLKTLDHLHMGGFLHGDIAARNFILSDDYEAYLVDFEDTRNWSKFEDTCLEKKKLKGIFPKLQSSV